MYERILFGFAILNLLRMSWQDIKTKKIDDRHNHLVLGATLFFGIITIADIWSFLIVIGLTIPLVIIICHIFKLAQGDASALTWINYSVGFLGLHHYIVFYSCFVVANVGYLVYKKIAQHDKTPKAYFPVLTITYIMFVASFYLL